MQIPPHDWLCSRVALALLRRAAEAGARFSVVVTEGRPDETGLAMARALDELHIPTTLVLDSGAAYCLERCAVRCQLVSVMGIRVLEPSIVHDALAAHLCLLRLAPLTP